MPPADVLRRERLDQRLARAYDRWGVSFGRWLERRARFGFGRNLIYVGQKP
jgi:hypothetical protein